MTDLHPQEGSKPTISFSDEVIDMYDLHDPVQREAYKKGYDDAIDFVNGVLIQQEKDNNKHTQT